MKKKRLVILIIVLLILSCALAGIFFIRNSIKKNVSAQLDVIKDGKYGDIYQINSGNWRKDFVTEEVETPDSYLYKNADVKLKGIGLKTIELEIVQADMSNFYEDRSSDLSEVDDIDKFTSLVEDYAENAKKTSKIVSLDYKIKDMKNIRVNYDNEDFTNAMTGGFSKASKELQRELENEWYEELGK